MSSVAYTFITFLLQFEYNLPKKEEKNLQKNCHFYQRTKNRHCDIFITLILQCNKSPYIPSNIQAQLFQS